MWGTFEAFFFAKSYPEQEAIWAIFCKITPISPSASESLYETKRKTKNIVNSTEVLTDF